MFCKAKRQQSAFGYTLYNTDNGQDDLGKVKICLGFIG